MRELISSEPRIFVFDLMADPQFSDFGVTVETAEDAIHLALKSGARGNFRIRLQFADVERFAFLCSALVKKPHGRGLLYNSCIAVDELSLFCSSYWAPEELKVLIRLGRHSGARLIATSQRPADIYSLILSQTKELYLFQMHLPRDVDYLRKFVPEIERVKNLKRGEFILWTPNEATPIENFSSE
jgi:hypothetical protein